MRNKPVPHVHAELIKAWADGAEIERYSHINGEWIDVPNPCWWTEEQYRIKPEPKPDVISNVIMSFKHDWKSAKIYCQWEGVVCPAGYAHNLDRDFHYFKFIFDGESDKLKSVEFVK